MCRVVIDSTYLNARMLVFTFIFQVVSASADDFSYGDSQDTLPNNSGKCFYKILLFRVQ